MDKERTAPRRLHIDRLDIDHSTSDTLPPRQTNAQQNETAYARLLALGSQP